MFDELGDRMKGYEDETRTYLSTKNYAIVRVDGKAFHTFTKGFKKPFDADIIRCMNEAATALCRESSGQHFAYVQSDEISLCFSDIKSEKTEMWFRGNVQKIASVSASIATAAFNRALLDLNVNTKKSALFDGRVWTINDPVEVVNYFRWRWNDCVRNSVSMLASSLFSHKELQGKTVNQRKVMCEEVGSSWDDLPEHLKYGRFVYRKQTDPQTLSFDLPNGEQRVVHNVVRKNWVVDSAPDINSINSYIDELLPRGITDG